MSEFRLDRTYFRMEKSDDAVNEYAYWKNKTNEERLAAAFYLNSVAYNFDINDPPRMDKTIFQMIKRK